MKYRKLDANGDYTFGNSSADFLENTPATVAQAVLTRLKLLQGEWFLDQTVGTPYSTEILGAGTNATYDIAIQQVILETEGVISLVSYSSSRDPVTRSLTIEATIDTVYSQDNVSTITITTTVPL